MTDKAFDPKCRELADHFLDQALGTADVDRNELAREIQQCVEDFLADLECCPSCGACPGFIGAECDETCDHAKAGNA